MALSAVLSRWHITSLDYAAILGTCVLTLLIYTFVQRRDARFRGVPYPPGPPGLPLLGNLLQVDVLRPHVQVRPSESPANAHLTTPALPSDALTQFLEWARTYGPVFRVRMGATQLVVLNSAAAADELLVNRGTTYSGRPSPHVAFDLVSDGQRMVFMGYNHAWRVRPVLLISCLILVR